MADQQDRGHGPTLVGRRFRTRPADSGHGRAPAVLVRRRRASTWSIRAVSSVDQPTVRASTHRRAQPARGVGEHRSVRCLLPLRQAERTARRRGQTRERVGELAMLPAEQADRHGARGPVTWLDRLGQLGVGIEQPEHLGSGPSATSNDETVQPTRRSPAYAVHRADRRDHPAAEPAQRTALPLRRQERVVAVDGHELSSSRPTAFPHSLRRRRARAALGRGDVSAILLTPRNRGPRTRPHALRWCGPFTDRRRRRTIEGGQWAGSRHWCWASCRD